MMRQSDVSCTLLPVECFVNCSSGTVPGTCYCTGVLVQLKATLWYHYTLPFSYSIPRARGTRYYYRVFNLFSSVLRTGLLDTRVMLFPTMSIYNGKIQLLYAVINFSRARW
jgi:hypothetical protein